MAVAWAAMPSPRPVKPRRSVVVAFTLTRSGSIPSKSASRAVMAGRWGPIFGRSQMRVTSTLTMRPPRVCHQIAGMGGEERGVRAAPPGIRGREVFADIAGGERPQDRVHQGVQSHVGVRMAGEGEFVGDVDAAEAHLAARAEAVHVEAGPGADFLAPDLLGAGEASAPPARGPRAW